jgi:hypothetical protein
MIDDKNNLLGSKNVKNLPLQLSLYTADTGGTGASNFPWIGMFMPMPTVKF